MINVESRPALRSVKFTNRSGSGLVNNYSSPDDARLIVILSAHRRACQAAQHRDLADVRKRICYRPLEKLLRRLVKRLIGSQVGIECFDGCKETPEFRFP